MTTVAVTAIICATALASLRLLVEFRPVAAASDVCGCGHPAAFHKDSGGCKRTHDGSRDCYGYCTCQRRYGEVATTPHPTHDPRRTA